MIELSECVHTKGLASARIGVIRSAHVYRCGAERPFRLRAPQIQALTESGPLQLSLFDERHLAETMCQLQSSTIIPDLVGRLMSHVLRHSGPLPLRLHGNS